MNLRTLLGLVLVGVVGLAFADPPRRPTTLCLCTGRKCQARSYFMCPDSSNCRHYSEAKNNGTLEHPSNEFFSNAEKTDMRSAVVTCRENLQRQAEAAKTS
ncbi:hypothetical protein MRX96_009096 [Rhipicephalus microplus]